MLKKPYYCACVLEWFGELLDKRNAQLSQRGKSFLSGEKVGGAQRHPPIHRLKIG